MSAEEYMMEASRCYRDADGWAAAFSWGIRKSMTMKGKEIKGKDK